MIQTTTTPSGRAGIRRGLLRAGLVAALGAWMLSAGAPGAAAQPFSQPDRDPNVNLRWDRYYDYDQMTEALRTLAQAYPRFLSVESIGQSWEGRDIWAVTINNPDTGPHTEKPAFYSDANIHGNEIQGTEVTLYMIWFLMENYDHLSKVRELVDTRAFYLIPSMNPDARQVFFAQGGPTRSGTRPFDADGDGRADEDPPQDLTGNREILQMRKHTPGEGTHMISPVDDRLLIVAPPGTKGDYTLLGSEGTDLDGDGRRNEDALGGYDINRNFPGDWQPMHIQGGAHWYPFSHPESRAIGDFLKARPNIAALQSWHNAGGMILRGPGSQYYRGTGDYTSRDNRTYDYLGARGELMLPYYRYMTVWKDLYTVYGGTLDWAHDALGVMGFTNELWSMDQLYQGHWKEDGPIPEEMQQLFFNDRLGLGAWFHEWDAFEHPDLGTVEIGGWSKWWGRTTIPFMIQEMLHRNAMFALFHADEMPLLELEDPRVERIAGSTWKVTAEVRNRRAIPSRIEAAELNNVGEPDYFRILGDGLTVQAGGFTSGELGDRIDLVDRNPRAIPVMGGVQGHSGVAVTWIVTGSGSATIEYASQKGGTHRTTVQLR
jgi:hypothetical protein